MFKLSFSAKFDGCSYIVSVVKTTSQRIGDTVGSLKFLCISLYLYKSTISSYMEYCCHVWSGTPSCYLDILD